MAINVDKAFDVDNDGLAIRDDDGNVQYYLCTGNGDPSGSPAPQNTFYFDNDTQLIHYKYGAGDNDWRQLRADDVTFDAAGLLNIPPTDDTVQKALATLGNQSIADIAEIEATTSITQETTTSDGWVSKTGFPWTSGSKTAGIFSIRWYMEVGQTKSTRLFGYRVRWREQGTTTWNPLGEVMIASNSSDDGLIMQSGFQEVLLPNDNGIEVDVQYGQTTSGFSAIIENVAIEVRRIGDAP